VIADFLKLTKIPIYIWAQSNFPVVTLSKISFAGSGIQTSAISFFGDPLLGASMPVYWMYLPTFALPVPVQPVAP
jgi:hypothetical protein